MDTPLPGFSMKNLNDEGQSTSTTREKCESLYSHNARLSTLFVSLDEQTLQSDTSLGTRVSSQENREKSSSGNITPYSGSGNEQTPHGEVCFKSQDLVEKEENSHSDSTRLTLLTCSVISLPLYNSQIHVSERSRTGRSPGRDNSLADSACKNSSEIFGQQPYTCCGVDRWKAGYAHLHGTNLSAPTTKSIGKSRQPKSTYRGVTRHRWTGKYEAHLWDGSCITEGHTRKGKQVYLGGYETAEEAARAHDLTALKYWGPTASPKLNFLISRYEKELEEMESMSQEEFVMSLRRKSISFTRGSSIYRGVTSRNRDGHWQARIKVASSKKDFYLGTFGSEEEAAKAYDTAAIELKGMNALTNFDISNYLQGGSKDSKGFSPPKRIRRTGKYAASRTLVPESDCQLNENIPDPDPQQGESIRNSDPPPNESIKGHILSSLLPDHLVAVIPN